MTVRAPGDGRPRIGVIGADLPRQLVLAAGATPVRILGSWSGAVSDEAGQLPGAVDVVAARILDGALAGAHDDLAALIVCNDSTAHLRVFYVLRILAERGRVPYPVHLLDAPRGGGAPRERFVARQYERLAAFCSAVTGTRPDAPLLDEAAERELRLGEALERLRARRRTGRCSGSAALAAYRAAATLAPEQALAVVDAAVEDVPGTPVFVTGSAHPDASAYEAIEAAGLAVVGEDHDTGDSAWLGDAVPAGDVDATISLLARRHSTRAPLAARSLTAERTAHLERRLGEADARGVIALVRELDDAPAWDAAAQHRVAQRRGLPLEARVRIGPDAGVRAAGEAAAALAGILRGEATHE
ncbi:2-hydroxyacyl-CoA dehydratase family protein [Microbacterium stercoris]|uniref:2-hydroxyacyl-CoA dehydratase n=1 Tax=Microbacterium stercoris TaxID=2820289 RepID=A0A939QJB9_9MICO|nr:2-hydroxyacyl-CoA dehydratase family protein [Microbacterium stercoris]MBO3663185.1 2-hydroxyacyl-CoA dehydratase [Microbacterium stercoris]